MPPNPTFWFAPSAERAALFVAALLFLLIVVLAIRFVFLRRLKQKAEAEFNLQLEQTGILGRPEEQVVRSLVRRYKISPATQLLSSLTHFDAAATEEIQRVETQPMPLQDRIDWIEYLYSIRILAFANEPAVSGIGVILRPVRDAAPKPDLEAAPTGPTETLEEKSPEWSALLGSRPAPPPE